MSVIGPLSGATDVTRTLSKVQSLDPKATLQSFILRLNFQSRAEPHSLKPGVPADCRTTFEGICYGNQDRRNRFRSVPPLDFRHALWPSGLDDPEAIVFRFFRERCQAYRILSLRQFAEIQSRQFCTQVGSGHVRS